MRAFFAIKPPQFAKQAILEEIQQLRKMLPDSIKWIREDQIHLTLKFIADLSQQHIEPIRAALLPVKGNLQPIPIETGTLSVFPHRRKPRVICCSVRQNQQIFRLWQCIEETAAGFGYPPDKRPLNPHLTIGRFNRQADEKVWSAVRSSISTSNPAKEIRFTAHSFYLIKSTLTPQGPRYENLFSIPL